MTKPALAASLLTLFCSSLVAADPAPPIVLRFGTAAPEGTAWARELRAYGADLERETQGAVKLKPYFGGVTGDEFETLERAQKGTLDMAASGGMACETAMPSIAVTRLLGVFQSREEMAHVAQSLRPLFEDEARKHGFELLVLNGMGADLVFMRHPVRTFDELRKQKLWRWNLDRTGSKMATLMGLQLVQTPLELAQGTYDRGEVDGFMAIPAGALAFQWSSRARYVLDLKTGFLEGCVLLAQRAFDRLTPAQQNALRIASTKFGMRFEALGAEQDALILDGVLAKQGVQTLKTSDAFRAQYFREANLVRDKLIEAGLVKRELVDRVLRTLAEYRAEHGAR